MTTRRQRGESISTAPMREDQTVSSMRATRVSRSDSFDNGRTHRSDNEYPRSPGANPAGLMVDQQRTSIRKSRQ